jgi:hypothetical protein
MDEHEGARVRASIRGGCRPPPTASQYAKVMWCKPQKREVGG